MTESMTAKNQDQMSDSEWWDAYTSSPRTAIEHAAARASLQAANLLCRATGSRPDIDQNHIADLLGVTKGRVSQVLNSDGNLHLATVAKYLRALGYQISLHAEPVDIASPALERKSRRHHEHYFSTTYGDGNGLTETISRVTTLSANPPEVIEGPWHVRSMASTTRPAAEKTAETDELDIKISIGLTVTGARR